MMLLIHLGITNELENEAKYFASTFDGWSRNDLAFSTHSVFFLRNSNGAFQERFLGLTPLHVIDGHYKTGQLQAAAHTVHSLLRFYFWFTET